jgi:DNA-binding response OmpR family regulator
LIVDDDADTREVLATSLRSEYTCTTVGSAEEASRLLAGIAFDVVVTDAVMPGASGFDLCSQVRKVCPDTIVIVVSGMTEEKYRKLAIERGAAGYLTKPLDVLLLQSLIKARLIVPGRERPTASANKGEVTI